MGSFFLYNRMVLESFQHAGVSHVIHIRVNRLWMAPCQGPGRLLMSSLGMPSGPVALFFASCVIHLWKVTLSIMRDKMLALSLLASAGVSSLMGSMPWWV